MRILIELESLKDCVYDKKYYSKLRGFLYRFQKDSLVFNRHIVEGYKLFTFSNIFPAKDMKTGDKRYLIISSPIKDFIFWMHGALAKYMASKKPVEIGEFQFRMVRIQEPREEKIGPSVRLITGTPIVVRIPKENYGLYGIESNRPYEYWRPGYDITVLLKQLHENLVKKYKQMGGTGDVPYFFEQFTFKRPVCVHRIEQGREVKTVGTIWEFGFSHLTPLQREVLSVGLDAGLGELNSSGFGFMNVVRVL